MIMLCESHSGLSWVWLHDSTPGCAAAVPMPPSGAGVTVLRLPLRVTGTQSLCYDSDHNARLARILVTDQCQLLLNLMRLPLAGCCRPTCGTAIASGPCPGGRRGRVRGTGLHTSGLRSLLACCCGWGAEELRCGKTRPAIN